MLEEVFHLCKGSESLDIRKAGGISAVRCLYIGGELNRGWWHSKWDTGHICFRTEALTILCIRQKINQLRCRQLFLGKHFVNSLIISALAR
jgi:hypothetical protein